MDSSNLIKVGKGALIAGLGAAGAYLLPFLTDGTLDLGSYGPLTAALLAVLVNFLRKSAFGDDEDDSPTTPAVSP